VFIRDDETAGGRQKGHWDKNKVKQHRTQEKKEYIG